MHKRISGIRNKKSDESKFSLKKGIILETGINERGNITILNEVQ